MQFCGHIFPLLELFCSVCTIYTFPGTLQYLKYFKLLYMLPLSEACLEPSQTSKKVLLPESRELFLEKDSS